jgi:hypothetical protein
MRISSQKPLTACRPAADGHDTCLRLPIGLWRARYAQGWRLTAEEEAAAIAELTQATAGRPDLLAERAALAAVLALVAVGSIVFARRDLA